MTAKFERITLWVSVETYSAKAPGISALDYILPALEELDSDCKILDYDTEDYKLVKARKAKGERDGKE